MFPPAVEQDVNMRWDERKLLDEGLKALIPSRGHWYSESGYRGLPEVTVSHVQTAIFKNI